MTAVWPFSVPIAPELMLPLMGMSIPNATSTDQGVLGALDCACAVDAADKAATATRVRRHVCFVICNHLLSFLWTRSWPRRLLGGHRVPRMDAPNPRHLVTSVVRLTRCPEPADRETCCWSGAYGQCEPGRARATV